MTDTLHTLAFLRQLVWQDLIAILLIVVVSRIIIFLLRWAIRHLAETVSPKRRLAVLQLAPKTRLIVEVAAIAIILPILVEPTFHNTIALIATVGLALAFALKDYVSSLAAGVVTILEGTYQPGDWIEVGGAYGEVKSVKVRAIHIVTNDDTEVIIPHAKLWSESVHNATSGNRSLLCVAPFYLDANHDGDAVRRMLTGIALSSHYLLPESKVTVTAKEKPWGTHYRLKAYAKESRDQFQFITDMTLRAKTALREMNVHFATTAFAETDKV
jgi:small conductance mechanosensitive channel